MWEEGERGEEGGKRAPARSSLVAMSPARAVPSPPPRTCADAFTVTSRRA